jgi:hypothetical protein
LGGCVTAEVPNIEKHHAAGAQLAGEIDRLMQQLLGDLGRNMLAENLNGAIAFFDVRSEASICRLICCASRPATRPSTNRTNERLK